MSKLYKIEKSFEILIILKFRKKKVCSASANDIVTLCNSENDIQQWSKEDKIRLCYLAALSGGLLGVNCKSAIPQHLAEMVIDLETFEQHPWGYEAVTDLVFCIKGITPERLSKESYSVNGFIQVLQILVYVAVPRL